MINNAPKSRRRITRNATMVIDTSNMNLNKIGNKRNEANSEQNNINLNNEINKGDTDLGQNMNSGFQKNQLNCKPEFNVLDECNKSLNYENEQSDMFNSKKKMRNNTSRKGSVHFSDQFLKYENYNRSPETLSKEKSTPVGKERTFNFTEILKAFQEIEMNDVSNNNSVAKKIKLNNPGEELKLFNFPKLENNPFIANDIDSLKKRRDN